MLIFGLLVSDLHNRNERDAKKSREPIILNSMKRSGWAPGTARSGSGSRKKQRSRTVNQILKDSYRLYARDRDSRKAVKACLG